MNKRRARTNDFVQIILTWAGTAMIVALVLVGMLFWHPGYRAWGIAAGGLILAMLIWMLRGLHERSNAVPGNPVHWVWLGLAAYLSVFQFLAQYFPKIVTPSGLSGFISISMILQLLLLSLGCMLFQEFMSKGQAARWLREITAICIILLSLGLDALFTVDIPHTSMWLLGCTGVMMAASNAFSGGASSTVGISGINRRHQVAIWGQLILAGLGLLWLLYTSTPKTFGLFLCIMLTVIAFSWACRRWMSKSAVFYIPAGILWWAIVMSGSLYFYNSDQPASFLGYGENAARYFDGIDDGVTVLVNMVGLVGVGGMFAGLIAVSMTVLLKSSGPGKDDYWKKVLWLAACWLATAAWMAKKSFFSIAPLTVVMMTWGLLITVANVKVQWHRAWRLALPLGLGIFWLAVANVEMLFQKAAFCSGYNDFTLHKIAGGVFCVFLVWWLARGRWWWAVPAVIIAAMAGGAGELFQKYFSKRSEDMRDWMAHLKGVSVLAAMLVFIFAGRAGLKCENGRIISASANWKKYIRVAGISGQLITIVIAFFFWLNFACDSLPGCAYRDIDLIATDLVIVSDYRKVMRKFYFPAMCNRQLYPGSAEFYGYYENSPQKPLFGCYTSSLARNLYSNISFFATIPAEGPHKVSLQGDPFSSCGYLRRSVIFQSISPDSKLLLIDTDSALKWAVEDVPGFVDNVQSLRGKYQLILVHPGPWEKYRKELPLLREIFPDIPVVGNSSEEWNLLQAAQKLRGFILLHKNRQRVICLTDNPYCMNAFAAGLGDYNCVRSIIVKPGYKLPVELMIGKRRHLFILRNDISGVLKELESGRIK